MDFESFKNTYENKLVQEFSNSVPHDPIISVCLQTYNHEKYIKDCLDGILSQRTNYKFEIIIGEDNSKDKTREICKKYALQFPDKIKLLLHHPENKISIENRITGRFNFMYKIYISKGKYIALVDGDDVWRDPRKLQKQVDFLEKHQEYSFSFHNTSIIDELGNILNDNLLNYKKSNFNAYEVISGLLIPTSSVVFRNCIKEFPNNFTQILNGDSLLFAQLVSFGNAYYHHDIINNLYRHHYGGLWSKQVIWKKKISSLKTFMTIKDNSEKKYYTVLNWKIASIYWELIKTIPGYHRKGKYTLQLIKYLCYYFLNRFFSLYL